MAENLSATPAGRELLGLLGGLDKQLAAAITSKVAELLQAEATKPPQQAAAAGASDGLRDPATAEALLPGISVLIPRGKFDLAVYADGLQLSNKQTSAFVPFAGIRHVLVVDVIPKQPGTTNVVLVMASGQAVKQGKNSHELVVLQTRDAPEMSLPAPAACRDLGDTLAGAAAVVLSQLLGCFIEELREDTFLTADPGIFTSAAGDLMVAANSGAQAGWLVPLSAGLAYIGKPGRFLPASAISKVLFHRAGGSSSTFDITLKLAGGQAVELGQIGAEELPKLQGYLMARSIRMGSAGDESDDEQQQEPAAGSGARSAAAVAAAAEAGADGDEDDSDEDDDDYDPGAGSGDADDEAPAAKRQRLAAAAAASSDDEDGDEEDAGSGDDSSDVSLIDEDALSGDDEDEE